MNYHNITKCDELNGEGIRVVLWTAGCAHACPGCHNPETWSRFGGILFDEAAKQEIFNELSYDYVSGITFSGGDPLFPPSRETIYQLAKEIKKEFPTKDIWLWTGYLWEDIKDLPIIKYIDVLCDGKFIQEEYNEEIRWVGSTNQRIIDVQKTIEKGEVVLFFDNSRINKAL